MRGSLRQTADLFQSTSSARRTTNPPFSILAQICISIHVLREEDDGAL